MLTTHRALIVAALIASGVSAGPTSAQERLPTWTTEVAVLGHDIVSMAARGRRVAVVARTDERTDGYDHFVAVADAKTGQLQWRWVFEGQRFTFARLAFRGRRLYAITTANRVVGDNNASVVALDAHDGRLLWEDRIPSTIDAAEHIFILPGTNGTVAIVPATTFFTAHLRAYDDRGERQWSFTLDFEVRSAAMRGRFLWIAGQVSGDWIVRCYDVRDGDLEWEDRFTIPTTIGVPDQEVVPESASRLAVRGDVLVVAGDVKEDPIVRAYAARSGKIRWTYTSVEDERPELPDDVILTGRKAIVAWRREEPGGYRSLRLDAYDLRTGGLVSQLPMTAFAQRMERRGETVFLAGTYWSTLAQPPFGEPWGFLMAIDTRGAFVRLWETPFFQSVRDVAVSGKSVFGVSGVTLAAVKAK